MMMTVSFMPVIAMIMAMVGMAMGRAGARLALLHRRFSNFLGRKLAREVAGNFDKGLCRNAVGAKLDNRHPYIGRLGKFRVKGDRAEERNIHHAGKSLPFVVSEQVHLVPAIAAV